MVVVTHEPPATSGADVAGQLIDAGRLDEILVFFAPVLLGAGMPLFTRGRDRDVPLTPLTDEDAHWYRLGDGPVTSR